MAAAYDPGKKSAKPLTLGRGKFEMPTSIYATQSGDVLFGEDADDEGITDLPNLIRRFKMKLGKPGLAQVGRKKGTAVQLTTEFLSHIRGQLENQALHAAIDRVILTVPAMFGPAQKEDLRVAAIEAGFSEVVLLAEPVAAGIAYCDHHSDLSENLRFLVVDWGGGTFDVAHVERNEVGELTIHEDFVVGLDDVGGEVFDDELWMIASRALEAAGQDALDLQPRHEWGKFRRDLCRAKERLSSQTSVSMAFILNNGSPSKVLLSREDFNNIIRPMIQKAASFVNGLLARAQESGRPPEFILLAGGTCRIPLIADELEQITGLKCRQWSEGRESIALGAAIKAYQLWGDHEKNNGSIKSTVGDKASAMDTYLKLLEAAWLDGAVSENERTFLERERKALKITSDEAATLEREISGSTYKEVGTTPISSSQASPKASSTGSPPSLPRGSTEEIIRGETSGFSCADIFFCPHIPERKAAGAIGSYAPHLRIGDILLLHDATVFGSCKQGFLMTADRLYWRNTSGVAKSVVYSEIQKISITESDSFLNSSKIHINEETIGVCSTPEGAKRIVKVCAGILRQLVPST